MYKADASSEYTKLVDIRSFPDLGGSPELLETTTLTDKAQTFILGIQQLDALEFDTNYTPESFDTLKALEGKEKEFAVWFGGTATGVPDGSAGKYKFAGELSVYVTGGGVNEVVGQRITIAPSEPIEKDTATP